MRYKRHEQIFKNKDTQKKLMDVNVIVIGVGGTGCSVLQYLVGSGVGCGSGKIGLMDNDDIEKTNLHRQILYRENDLKKNKIKVARDRAKEINSDCNIEIYNTFLNKENIEIIGEYEYVFDCSDNSITRVLINEYCKKNKKCLIYGSAIGMDGQVAIFDFKTSDVCLECVFPNYSKTEESCSSEGVLGPIPGIIGSIQVLEFIKKISGVGEVLDGVLHYSFYDHSQIIINFEKNKQCRLCNSLKKDEESIERSFDEYKNDKNKILIDIMEDDEEEMYNSIKMSEKNREEIIKYIKDSDKNIYVICKYGIESKRLIEKLRKEGIDKCWSISGGIKKI